ncbi:hypothetical protein VULLAG_LOCUS2056 [Vulpes lagopus]
MPLLTLRLMGLGQDLCPRRTHLLPPHQLRRAENDGEVKGENKLHYSFRSGSRSPLKMGHPGRAVMHSRSQLVLCKKREYN